VQSTAKGLQASVNRLVAGSNPARGAKQYQLLTANSLIEKRAQKATLASPVATILQTSSAFT
jgi:hypothetical protein